MEILHRDLKSLNIVVEIQLSALNTRIIDFGSSKVISQISTKLSDTVGTIIWMAPELLEGQPYDHKIDIYSFSIVLWEILTGKEPYEEIDLVQIPALGNLVSNQSLQPRLLI